MKQREIKFRAWDKKHKKMYDDVGVMRGECIKFEDVPFGEMLIFRDLILMQYTGLKDKNGKEIYEGDIVWIYTKSGQTSYKTKIEDIRNVPTGLEDCEVIGNIYENPELLVNNEK